MEVGCTCSMFGSIATTNTIYSISESRKGVMYLPSNSVCILGLRGTACKGAIGTLESFHKQLKVLSDRYSKYH